MITLLVGDLMSLPIIFLGVRYGAANNYTVYDWVSLLLPAFDDSSEFISWLMLLPLIFFPICTVLVFLIELFARPNKITISGDKTP